MFYERCEYSGFPLIWCWDFAGSEAWAFESQQLMKVARISVNVLLFEDMALKVEGIC